MIYTYYSTNAKSEESKCCDLISRSARQVCRYDLAKAVLAVRRLDLLLRTDESTNRRIDASTHPSCRNVKKYVALHCTCDVVITSLVTTLAKPVGSGGVARRSKVIKDITGCCRARRRRRE
jgi:hypothetical protein